MFNSIFICCSKVERLSLDVCLCERKIVGGDRERVCERKTER